MHCLIKNKHPLPFPLDVNLYNEIASINEFTLYDLMYLDKNFRKVTNYYFFQYLKKLLISSQKNEASSKKFIFISSHDSNLISTILGLGFPRISAPSFCSDFTIETFEDKEKKLYIECKYERETLSIGQKFTFPIDEFNRMIDKEIFYEEKEFLEAAGRKELIPVEWILENYKGPIHY